MKAPGRVGGRRRTCPQNALTRGRRSHLRPRTTTLCLFLGCREAFVDAWVDVVMDVAMDGELSS